MKGTGRIVIRGNGTEPKGTGTDRTVKGTGRTVRRETEKNLKELGLIEP